MKTVAIMPIKTNNERCPGKNTRLLGNLPLLNHQLRVALQCEYIDEVYVYCSDESIKDYLPDGVTFLKRDPVFDLPTSNFSQIFDSFIEKVPADIYAYIHATAPYITLETYNECISNVINNDYDTAFCAERIQDYLWFEGKALNFDSQNVPRSQDLKPIYRETSGIYVIPREVWGSLKRRVGNKPFIKELSFKESIDINTENDFKIAEIMMEESI